MAVVLHAACCRPRFTACAGWVACCALLVRYCARFARGTKSMEDSKRCGGWWIAPRVGGRQRRKSRKAVGALENHTNHREPRQQLPVRLRVKGNRAYGNTPTQYKRNAHHASPFPFLLLPPCRHPTAPSPAVRSLPSLPSRSTGIHLSLSLSPLPTPTPLPTLSTPPPPLLLSFLPSACLALLFVFVVLPPALN
jgi:hypothetical protein